MPDENEEWVARAVRKLKTCGLLTDEQRVIVDDYLQAQLGVDLDSIEADGSTAPITKRTVLTKVTAAVGNDSVASLKVVTAPAGRLNPLWVPGEVTAPLAPPPVIANGHAPDDSSVAALLVKTIRDLTRGNTPVAAPLDEARVKEIAEGVVSAYEAAHAEALRDSFKAIADQLNESAKGQAQRLEIVHPDGKVIDMGNEPRHWQFDQLLCWISANVPVWTWGKSGGGKTTMAYQLAKALDVKAFVIPVDETMTVGKLVGYTSQLNGEFIKGQLYTPFKEGGLAFLDEIDTVSGIITCTSSLLANGHYMFPNGEIVERHPKFYIVGSGNSKGTGAVAGYSASQKIDARTINRFAIIEMMYDERLEEILAVGDSQAPALKWSKYPMASTEACRRWVKWVQKVRSRVGNSVLVSPRASILGAKALRAGVAVTEVADALVFALVTEDTKSSIINACGRPPS